MQKTPLKKAGFLFAPEHPQDGKTYVFYTRGADNSAAKVKTTVTA